MTELSSEGEGKLFNYHVEKSKRKNDWHFREANMISGSADYIPGYDDGGTKVPLTNNN